VKNTVAKIIVDQVIGGAWNTVAFIATMGMLRGQDYEVIKGQIQNVRILNQGFLADVMFLFEPTRNQQLHNLLASLTVLSRTGLLADYVGRAEIVALCLDFELYRCPR
jgi:hypothetical protein